MTIALIAAGNPAKIATARTTSTTSASVQPTFSAPFYMHDQMGLACAERCKRRNGGELAALYVERGTRIDMAEHNSIK